MPDHLPPPTPAISPFVTLRNMRESLSSAVLARAGFNNANLNSWLRQRLSSAAAEDGALVGESVIEGAASYEQSAETWQSLRANMLHAATVDALTNGSDGDDYRFHPQGHPYRHQHAAFTHLTAQDPRSVLVTSGTGSGKTECFLVPLLDDLAREAERSGDRLSGVRAIMLYPLNALIASQQERLRRWTSPFKGRIRFGLFNGLMPNDSREYDREREAAKHPEEVADRRTLRADPPPILVTNVTMLEYMTIRREDRPLIDKSAGKLRWIIIDEAHSYVGSAAAEIALLIRRVLLTFNVLAKDVRFVATSATIGEKDEESEQALRRFLADLAGVPDTQVYVIRGRRTKVALPTPAPTTKLETWADRAALASNPIVQAFIKAAETDPLPLTQAEELLSKTGQDPSAVMKMVADDSAGQPLLPLRLHHFMRAVPGLWSCLNPKCTGERPDDWPYGSLAFEKADQCQSCGGKLFEIVSCQECGEPYLQAGDNGDQLVPLTSAPDIDEFVATRDGDGIEEDEADTSHAAQAPIRRRLIALRNLAKTQRTQVEPLTGVLPDRKDQGQPMPMTPASVDIHNCPACFASHERIRPFRFGAPFLVGYAATVVLDGLAPENQSGGLLPAAGRRLLSFTDSRQGTARFAANLETNAERAYLRGYLYHLVQKSALPTATDAANLKKLQDEAEALEASAGSNAILAELARDKRAEIAKARSGSTDGIEWPRAKQALAQDPMVHNWIRQVWKDRDERFARTTDAFAEFLLLRELVRRPRRANALETLGLVRLRFHQLDKLTQADLPAPLCNAGRDIAEWRDFLYLLVDRPVRANFGLQVDPADIRWLAPRRGRQRNIAGPREDRRDASDILWPQAWPGGSKKTNAVLWLEKSLNLQSEDGADRAAINEILDTAWTQLRPLLEGPGPERALDLGRAYLAPVKDAWLCPVTRRVLTHTVFGRSPYGHRESSPLAEHSPVKLKFPQLPLPFPLDDVDRALLADWLQTDAEITLLREQGVWNNLTDRAALLAPYLRAEEHSAQQPPGRLRAFENEFRKGEINVLACSTTMEMGVDIGAVSAVLMTNVPPSIANYRQRVGRAGRRNQPFATALTYARDTPLDRETFLRPADYMARKLRAPSVKLDSERIVRRHVNALLLAHWISQARGEPLKLRTGAFFGFTEQPEQQPRPQPTTPAPIEVFCDWLELPSTRNAMGSALSALTKGTAIEHEKPAPLCEAASEAFKHAHNQFRAQWEALQGQAREAASVAARRSVAIQLARLCREGLLKELGNCSVLPSHGFPSDVLPFLNLCAEVKGRPPRETEDNDAGAPTRRYDFPTRKADVALREYAPGAEVVIDGLVWTSAGVTLNWQRPPHAEATAEIQSLRHFWQCDSCGAADCGPVLVNACPACSHAPVRRERYLAPAGFRVEWTAKPHADTDEVTYITPIPPRISARDATWAPLLDPALGRCRATSDGLVFHASKGASRNGYRICLDCGRAAEGNGDQAWVTDHAPLWRDGKGARARCTASDRPFAVTEPMALGYEVRTDVAELQPTGLAEAGAAWALVSAFRESLSRRLGIEVSELGIGVAPRQGALAGKTHSLFLFDTTPGGAGFATKLLDDLAELFQDAEHILNCQAPGCERGCSACVLTADLFEQQNIIDRRPALLCVAELRAGIRTPSADDAALPHAKLSRPTADELARQLSPGDVLTLFSPDDFDLKAISAEPFASLLQTARKGGASTRLALRPATLNTYNAAQRLGLRDLGARYDLTLIVADAPAAPNGATLLATRENSSGTTAWYTRDRTCTGLGAAWGIGQQAPVVYGQSPHVVNASTIDPKTLLPTPTTAILEISDDPGRRLDEFGPWFTEQIRSKLEPLSLWRPGALASISYSDRYLRSPLTVALSLRACAGLRDALALHGAKIPLRITSSPLSSAYARLPFHLHDDWQRASDRDGVAERLAQFLGFVPSVAEGAPHWRELCLTFKDGATARMFLDRGFGYWQSRRETFDFAASAERQAQQLRSCSTKISGTGPTYIAIIAETKHR